MNEKIVIEDIHNMNICPLTAGILTTDWSPDNQISVITTNGVQIFELLPSPMSSASNFKFQRSFIYPPDVQPANEFQSLLESKISKLKSGEYSSIILKKTVLPKISDTRDINPFIKSISWSPRNMVNQNRCMLATCTWFGAVDILHKVSTTWYSICDLTSHKLNQLNFCTDDSIKKCQNEKEEMMLILNQIKRSVAVAIIWSNIYCINNKSFAYLAVAYQSSEITIWKISNITDFSENLEPEYIHNIQLDNTGSITSLCWIDITMKEYLIIVGYSNGNIHSITISDKTPDTKYHLIEKYIDDSDRMQVDTLKLISQNQLGIKIIATKNIYLLLLHLTPTGKLININYLHIGGFRITGIVDISTDKLIVSSQNANLYLINIKDDSLEKFLISHNLLKTNMQYVGLARSPNSVIFLNVAIPNTIYDHLRVREPCVMNFFTIHGNQWDPLNIISKNKKNGLKILWDVIELLRIKLTKSTELCTILSKVPENLESMSLFDLQISMWMSLMTSICKKKKIIQGIQNIAGEISEAQPLIFIHSTCAHLNHLASKHSLTSQQQLCVRLLRMYLEIYLAGEDEIDNPLIESIKNTLSVTSKMNTNEIEVCELCKKPITELPWTVKTCISGHKLPRCARTLLQITSTNYRTCPICGQIFHSSLDDEYDEVRCLFCDIPPVYDHRLINVANSKLYKRNLSRPQAPYTFNIKEEETS